MSYSSDRIVLLDKDGAPLGDLDVNHLLAVPRMVEEVNGEHTLTIRTTDAIQPLTRALWRDLMGEWHEWVYEEPRERHRENEYVFTWSLQADLTLVGGTEHWASLEPGTHDPVSAHTALGVALSDQTMWEVGDVTVMTEAGVSLYDGQTWDYVRKVVEAFGGELSATIMVGDTGVISRKVNLLAHVGSTTVTRRFDYGHDVTDITRTPEPAPYYCRVRPRGGTSKTDADGVDYSDRIGIEGVTEGGEDYIEDDESALVFRSLNPDGSWFYPTKVVCYSLDTEGDDEELYEKALADLHEHTRPKVTYEASVTQFARAGLDYQGIAEGDNIQIVDRCFSTDGTPLRLEGRVLRIEQDLPVYGANAGNAELTISNLSTTISEVMQSITNRAVSPFAQKFDEIMAGGTIVYLNDLIRQMNAELNVTGGYYYFVPGEGIYTYDAEVSDPTVGAEASQVTQIVGGGMRIANSRTQSGDWDWRTVFTSGHLAADLVTAANIEAGYIGSPDGSVFLDLDNGVFRIGPTALVGSGDTTVQDMMDDIGDARRMATDFLTYENGELIIGATNSAIRNVMTNSRNSFRTEAGDVAYFGLNDNGIWEMYIDTATVLNRLQFNRFSWIARQNGNMSIKLTV